MNSRGDADRAPELPPPARRRSETVELEFNQAMADFKKMFPGLDSEIIEAVLRAHNGAVDASIDELLTMASAETAAPPKRKEVSRSASVPTSSAAASEKEGPPLYAASKWKPPLLGALPPDFLRIKMEKQQRVKHNQFPVTFHTIKTSVSPVQSTSFVAPLKISDVVESED
ncbi:unnamed protein product [Cyprideis torosa]|uniref:Uncharacterized protein n=1 Tax=Cyprideis torosa TaxID=163714 RepID=A0A7R8WEW9_9CRUS|nr:unnamed protein product [Cyprideis torosa]CAG0896334.1 unnamed protein product [Cyprideis torosa]